jgi:alcohol dehydrogenase (cytochrome c)
MKRALAGLLAAGAMWVLPATAQEHPSGAAPGPFTEAQAARGAKLYAEKCVACHGDQLQGKTSVPLAGPQAMARWAEQSVSDLFTRTRTMPFGAPQSLSTEQYLDLTAFMLSKNGFKPGPQAMTTDPSLLSQIRLAGGGAAPKPQARLLTQRDVSAAVAGGPTQAELTAAGPKTSDWLFTNHDYAGQRFVDLKQITRRNVAELRPVCMYQVGDLNPFPTNPLVYKGAMYITTRDATVSIDAKTCQLNWRYDRPSRVPLSYGLKMNRGAAIKDGKLVFGTHDGFLVALDAGTGKVVWERDVADATGTGGGFTQAPMLFEDLVLIGPAGSEMGVKGWIGAFRLDSGEPVWRFNTVPDDGEPGAETWPNSGARAGGGGAVWGSLSLNVEEGRVYVPVSNPTPDWDGDQRLGDNLYTDSLVVLDARTGRLQWYHQVTPHDTHDWDVTQASPQYTATVKGKTRKVVIAAGKEGTVNALDRDTHELLFQTAVTTRSNVDTPWVGRIDGDPKGPRVCPGAVGGIQWNGGSYNPGTGMLYVPAVDWCAMTRDPLDQQTGWLTAVDAGTGEVRWKYHSKKPMVAAVTSTSADLVLTGEMSGDALALDAKSGEVLWRFNTGGRITGGVVTYDVGGEQYVAVTSGGANAFWQAQPGSATVTVFGLK